MGDFEVSGMREWVATLETAGERVPAEGAKIVGQGCNNIKRTWQGLWTGWAHIPHLPWAITYDVDDLPNGAEGVVGPLKTRRQGGLGSYIELGTPTSAPIPGGWPAVDEEEPRFIRAVADLGERMLGAS